MKAKLSAINLSPGNGIVLMRSTSCPGKINCQLAYFGDRINQFLAYLLKVVIVDAVSQDLPDTSDPNIQAMVQ